MPGSRRTDRSRSFLLRLLLLVPIAVAAGACSSAAAPPQGAAGAPARAPEAAASAGGGDTAGASSGGGTTGNGSQAGGGSSEFALVDDTKIVRTGSLQLTVADTDKALLAGRDAIKSLGGYIGDSQLQRLDGKAVATVTYRIPVARWEDALAALRGLGTEIDEQTKATEVTAQLVDLDARIRNLRASEAALVGYAAKAPKISDLLEVEARLTDTRGQIERLTAEQATLADQVAMSTLTVTYGTEVVAVTDAAKRWDPSAEVDRASATLLGVGQAIVSFLIVFAIVWLPILVVSGVILLIGLAIARRLGWQRPRPQPPVLPVPPPSAAPEA